MLGDLDIDEDAFFFGMQDVEGRPGDPDGPKDKDDEQVAPRRRRMWAGSTAAQRGALGGIRSVCVRREKAAAKRTIGARKLGEVWNKLHGLRHGDRVNVKALGGEDSKKDGKQVRHPNQWTIDGFVRFVLRRVGSRGGGLRKGVGNSTRTLAATSALAQISNTLQNEEVHKFWEDVEAGSRDSIVVRVSYDCTPMLVSLGRYKCTVAPFARYLVKADDGKWELKSLEAYQNISKRAIPSNAVVEICAQELMLQSRTMSREKHHRRVLTSPMVLQNGGASAMFAASQRQGSCTIDIINRVTSKIKKPIIFTERPDAARANIRLQREMVDRLGPYVLYDRGTCAAHGCHLVVEKSLRDSDIVGDLFAIQMVIQVTSHQNRMIKMLHELVRRRLVFLDGRLHEPDPANLRHTRQVLQHTIGWRTFYRRACAQEDDNIVTTAEEHKIVQRIDAICKLDTGDIRNLTAIHHHCVGCCADAEACVGHLTSAYVEAGILFAGVSEEPSKSRWGSTGVSNSIVTAGLMLHDVLSATVEASFTNWLEGDPGDDEDDDYRYKVQRKVWRTRCLLRDPHFKMQTVVRNFCSVDISHLWQRLQYIDGKGSTLYDAMDRKHSPFRDTIRRITAQLGNGGRMAIVLRHFQVQWASDMADQAPSKSEIVDEARHILVSQAAQLWWRFCTYYETWPYKFLEQVHPRYMEEDRQECARKFYHLPACCQAGDQFTSKVARIFPRGDGPVPTNIGDESFKSLLEEWGEGTTLSNMHVERLLSQIKASCPKKRPPLESILAAGTLCQWRREHRQVGGVNYDESTGKELAEEGVPLRRAAHPKNAKMKRAHIDFGNQLVREDRRRRALVGEKMTKAEVRDVRRAAKVEFDGLADDARERLHRHAQVESELPEPLDRFNLEGLALWGLCTRDLAVDPARVEELIFKTVGDVGADKFTSHFRDQFCEANFVKDGGDIPKAKKHKHPKPCHIKHPGLCQGNYDKKVYASIRQLASSLYKHAGDESKLYQVYARRADGSVERSFFLYTAYKRGLDPKMVVYASCSLSHDEDALELTVAGNEVYFMTNFEVAMHLKSLTADKYWSTVVEEVSETSTFSKWFEPRVGEHDQQLDAEPPKRKPAAEAEAAAPDDEVDEDMKFFLAGIADLGSEPRVPAIDPAYVTSEDGVGSSDDEGDDPDCFVSASEEEGVTENHVFLWITRTGRKAQCAACGRVIHPWAFRLLYHPNPNTVPDKRMWGRLWWKYYHLDAACVAASPAELPMMDNHVVDAARPRLETMETYEAACREAVESLRAALSLGDGGAAASAA